MKLRILPIVILLLGLSCQQEELSRINFLEILTYPAQDVTLVSATVSGEIKGIQARAVEQYGFVWSTTDNKPTFAVNEGRIPFGAKESDGVFSSELTNLDKDQMYFVRSFVLSEQGEKYGETISFITADIQITTDSLAYVQARTATIHGTFNGVDAKVEINKLGIVWSTTNPEPVISGATPDQFVELDAPLTDGAFFGMMTNLEDSTTYYYRTFAILNFGNEIIYGSTQTWETNLVDVWKQKGDLPGTIRYGYGFAFGTTGFIVVQNKAYKYDQTSDLWETMTESGQPGLGDAGVFAIGTNIYIACGRSNVEPYSKKFYKYDTVNDSWDTTLPDFPGEARRWAVGFGIGDAGYVGVGQGESGSLSDFWKYDETNGWTELTVTNPDFPGTTHRVAMGSYSDNVRGYIAGDQNSSNFWMYTPETNTWEEKNPLPGGRSLGMTSFHINNRLYLGTGTTQGQGFSRVLWRYNHENDTWTELASLPGLPRGSAMSFAIGNKGYIGGGSIPQIPGTLNITDDFWEYKAPPD